MKPTRAGIGVPPSPSQIFGTHPRFAGALALYLQVPKSIDAVHLPRERVEMVGLVIVDFRYFLGASVKNGRDDESIVVYSCHVRYHSCRLV